MSFNVFVAVYKFATNVANVNEYSIHLFIITILNMASKLEDCQTSRYHENCGNHSTKMVTSDTQGYLNVPMLSMVNGCLYIINSVDVSTVFPTVDTTINCRGEVIMLGRFVESDQARHVGFSLGLVMGAMLNEAAKAKDRENFSVKFMDIIAEFIEVLKDDAMTMQKVQNALYSLKRLLMEME